MCTSEHYVYTVSGCAAGSEKRSIEFQWIDPLVCETIQLPPTVEIDCGKNMIPAGNRGGWVIW